jgi:hypothetical protein
MNRTGSESARTRISIEPVKRFVYAKYRARSGSSSMYPTE